MENAGMERFLTPLFLFVIAVLLGMYVALYSNANGKPELATPYQAVLLQNGQVFFGQLTHADSAYPVLRNAFYIRSQQHPEPKPVNNTLIKRGQEWHAPDAMVINRQHIVVIEPVKADSQVAKLIEEASKR